MASLAPETDDEYPPLAAALPPKAKTVLQKGTPVVVEIPTLNVGTPADLSSDNSVTIGDEGTKAAPAKESTLLAETAPKVTSDKKQIAPDGSFDAGAVATDQASTKGYFQDIKDDLVRRAPHYWDDWRKGLHPVIISASSFMFFTSFFPALIFGEQLHTDTNGLMGIADVLLSTGLTGCVWSIVAGQPLIIVGVTGPVAIFTAAAYGIADILETDFFIFHSWICIWAALMHFAIAVSGSCSAVKRVTNFAGETFAFFIAAIYIYNALSELFEFSGDKDFLHAAMDGWLGFGSFYMAITFHYARDWTFFNRQIREYIAQYGAAAAIVTWTLVATYGAFSDNDPDLLDVPEKSDFKPTARKYPFSNGTNENCGQYCHSTETNTGALEFEEFCKDTRGWIINPFDSPDIAAVAVALPCGGLLTLLFFFDHNVSSLLSQDPIFKLKKGSAFHYDFLVLGCNVLLCGILGIPTANGLIPQAPLHVRALSKITVQEDSKGQREEVFEGVQEQRLSNLLQSLMMVLVMFYFDAPGLIPKAVLQGLFLYMGVTTLDGLTFWERTKMLFQEPALIPPHPWLKDNTADCRAVVRNYTIFQLLIWLLIFAVSGPWAGAISIVFPFLIAALVPVREHILPRIFGEDAVLFIDSAGETGDADAATSSAEPEIPASKIDSDTSSRALAAVSKASGAPT